MYVWSPNQNTKKSDAVIYKDNDHTRTALNQVSWDWNVQNSTGISALVKTALGEKDLCSLAKQTKTESI